ncbi:uncharacterized protein DUF4395 [Breznakibacter xylanolyticus]|uniref:Uncharacterized protein DUF4395 n=1 Tax=Breznakibacter xylanolyticus TaxID=990 RepID=A0A2W7MXH8_9BACT|nr:DUF4395 domain-containing protein [Breznakibacter xylanolyticus]PZX12855.1 uncharacterized protein DUF4395 [Breznakibacter xylanolyticus]
MKRIICPVSFDRVPSHLPRVNAVFVVLLLLGWAWLQWHWILMLLLADFFLRGFDFGRWSPLMGLSGWLSQRVGLISTMTDKAPKMFAARLGLAFVMLILVLSFVGEFYLSMTAVFAMVVLALLEAIVNFCVGCYLYHWMVHPFKKLA